MKKDTIHLKSPGNWINDPNGFIYYRGMYHLFYQHFPYAPRWGTMHWGHAVSKDLVHWEHQGIALYPTKFADQNGCFSGSAVEYEGRMHIFYTGVRYLKTNPEDIHNYLEEQFEASQLTITSEDGVHFDNERGKNVVIPPIAEAEIGDRTHTRDPKVWRGRDAWYMVLGSTACRERGKLLFYRSENLTDWALAGSTSEEEGLGWMWECPDYFETSGGKVLLISPMGLETGGKNYKQLTVCMVVDFDEDTCTMELPGTYQLLDYGQDLYAPQSTTDAEGRRVLVAWLRMPEAVEGSWSGMFCIPRVVEVQNGHIYFRVHPNVEKLYSRRIRSADQAAEAGYRVSLEPEDGETVNIGGYRISRRGDRICTDRSAVFCGHTDLPTAFETPPVKEGFHLDVYVDPHLIEVFVNRGEYVISNAVYGLSREIRADNPDRLRIDTLE